MTSTSNTTRPVTGSTASHPTTGGPIFRYFMPLGLRKFSPEHYLLAFIKADSAEFIFVLMKR
jgi:hypothetical protein